MDRAPLHLDRLRPIAALLALACGGGAGDKQPVGPPPAASVARIDLAPGNVTLPTGTTIQFHAAARDAAGGLLAAVGVSWSTSAAAVASVSSAGLVSALAPGIATITAAAGGKSAGATITVQALYDLDALGVPRIVTADYIELSKVARISRFRSGIGHDYADDVEQCRSMKHYFQPSASVDWASIVIRSPVDGTVGAIIDEQTFGKQVRLVPSSTAAATVIIFHVNPDPGLAVGTVVSAGMRLGTHIGSATMSDVAILLETPRGRRLVSWFDAMTDAVFAGYQSRGVSSRSAAVITASERDGSPLTCNGEAFAGSGTIQNWLDLP